MLLHGYESGVILRDAQGGYTERHLPLSVDRAYELTARERDVLGLVATGLPNKAIARRLAISEKTVKAHLTRVFAVVGVSDRTSAALWAQRHGLT